MKDEGRTKDKRKKSERSLEKHIKELRCLYGIASITERPGITIDEIYQQTVELLPQNWQRPEVACAQLIIGDKEFKTANYRETRWRQTADIKVHGIKAGTVGVGYLKERPASDEGPFLEEERQLINAVAERLGRITERIQTEESLKESEAWFSATLRGIGDAVIATDGKGNVKLMNPVAQKLTGWNEKDAVGNTLVDIFNIVNEETGKQAENPVARVIREGVVVGLANHTALIAKDGTRCSIDDSGAPIKDEKGNVIGVILVFRDVTEQRKLEHNLNERLKELSCLYGIASITERPGITIDEIYQQTVELLPQNWQRPEVACAQLIIGDKEFKTANYRETRWRQTADIKVHGIKAGTVGVGYLKERPASDEGPFLEEERQLINAVAERLGRITERIQTEESLKESESRFRQLANSLPQLVWTCQPDGPCDFLSEQWIKYTGIPAERQFGYGWLEQLHPDDRQPTVNAWQKAVASDNDFQVEFRIRSRDGEYRIFDTRAVRLHDVTGHTVKWFGSNTDITERKQAEAALIESEIKYRGLAENLNELIYRCNPKTFVATYVNKSIERLYGYTAEEWLKDPTLWESTIHPDDKERVFADLAEANKMSQPYIHEYRILRKDKEVRWVEDHLTWEKDQQGNPVSINGVIYDITERKQTEEREKQLNIELNSISRLATVGEMAAGISHEINNPLTGVVGFSDLLLKRDLPDDIRKDVDIIHEGARRIASIIDRMLRFARQTKSETKQVNINDIIETTLDMRTSEMKTGNINVTTELAPDLPLTSADAGLLQQVFLNIILNAEQAMKLAHDKGSLTIKTERIDNTIRASFKDDGPGIAKENMERLFNPFFTTRDPDKGTGLGLSICYNIIKQHDGNIYAKSTLGKGATFFVELPVVDKGEQLKMDEPTAIESKSVSKARILVVDDDSVVQEFITAVLAEEGHEVEIVDNGDDAMERLGNEEYDVILLDIKLLGKSGIEIYEELQKKDTSKTKKVIFITGDVMSVDTMVFIKSSQTSYIAKPFDAAQLVKEIDRIMSQKS
ncbi:PAS domain S-box protein [Chloroflexota bacterium]